MAIHAAQLDPFALSGAGAIAGATSIVLKSFQTIDGVNLTMSDFGAIGYATLEPGNGVLEEQISFSGVVQNSNGTATLSGIKSVLFLSPYTESSGLSKTHAGSTTMVISNTSGWYNQIPFKQNDETITGQWTFSVFPITPSNTPASTTVAGIVQEATLAQTRSRTQTGSTGAELFMSNANVPNVLISDYVADTGAANAYAIAPTPAITAYTAGQQFTFKAVHANTTASTLNVNGLGTKNITNVDTTALVANDIVAGQIVLVEYDGTQFQLLSRKTPATATYVSSVVYNTAQATKNLADSTAATQTIAHGLGVVPKKVRIRYLNVSSSNKAVGSGDGSFMNSVYTALASIFIQGTSANSVSDNSTAYIIKIYDPSTDTAGGANQTATVAVDATNITLTWSKTGSPTGTVVFVWEAEGYTTASITA